MATKLEVIYESALGKMTEDDWGEDIDFSIIESDLLNILKAAIPYFKRPRNSLTINVEEGVIESDLTIREIEIIATYMSVIWLDRTILSWENVKPMYSERDFSPGNTLDNLRKLLASKRANAEKLESIYYRNTDSNKPFDYTKLAGGK